MKEELQNIQLESKDILIDILKDTIEDKNKVVKRLQVLLSIISVLSLMLLFGIHLYNDWSFKSFLSQYDLENTVTANIETKADNNSKINNSGTTNASNNINLNIPDIFKKKD